MEVLKSSNRDKEVASSCGYVLNCFESKIGTNSKENRGHRAAEMTASSRMMELARRPELYGPTQRIQSDRYL